MEPKTALLIGRFQPFHLGHLYLVKKALAVADRIVVGIGSANLYDSNNPLDWKTRHSMLKAVFYKERLEDKVREIVPLDDFFNDEKWLNNVKLKMGKFDCVVGNNEWVNRIMKKGGYDVVKVPYYKRYLYEGEKIRGLLMSGGMWEKRVPGYLINFIRENLTMNLESVALGGTFDRFHKGHRAMLDRAFTVSKTVSIGVATEELYKDKFLGGTIEPFTVRKKYVRDYLSKKNWLDRAKIIGFSDFKGPLDKKKSVEGIIVSRQTLPNAIRINRMREDARIPALKTIIVEDVLASDGKMISSARIRGGEMDREGITYSSHFKKILLLPEALRSELRRPLGKVVKGKIEDRKKIARALTNMINKTKPVLTIAVGDIIAASLEEVGLFPDVKIVDFRSRRTLIPNFNGNVGNGPINKSGTINPDAVTAISVAIKESLRKKTPETVKINGEEDLLALPAILLAPLGSMVLYGHWELGVVVVQIDEMIKRKIVEILTGFIAS